MAGPFHPAFGELVEQEVFKEQAGMAIQRYKAKIKADSELIILVHEKDISKNDGNRKSNLDYLKSRFHLQDIKVKVIPPIPAILSAGG